MLTCFVPSQTQCPTPRPPYCEHHLLLCAGWGDRAELPLPEGDKFMTSIPAHNHVHCVHYTCTVYMYMYMHIKFHGGQMVRTCTKWTDRGGGWGMEMTASGNALRCSLQWKLHMYIYTHAKTLQSFASTQQ